MLIKIETKDSNVAHKAFDTPIEIKELTEQGTFTGYGAIFGNEDRGGDIIQKGAFVKSLEEYKSNGRKIPMLWQHNSHNPIGFFDGVKEDETGLVVTGHIDMDVQAGKEAYSRLKKGYINGLSIGYSSVITEYNEEDNTRLLKELDLFEISLVTFPMNDDARIQDVKNRIERGVMPKSIADFEKFLRDAGFSKKHATTIASHGIKPLLKCDTGVEELKATTEMLKGFSIPKFNEQNKE